MTSQAVVSTVPDGQTLNFHFFFSVPFVPSCFIDSLDLMSDVFTANSFTKILLCVCPARKLKS